MSTLKHRQAAYDALPLASKLEAIRADAAAARTQDEYTAAGERAIRLLPQIMQALSANASAVSDEDDEDLLTGFADWYNRTFLGKSVDGARLEYCELAWQQAIEADRKRRAVQQGDGEPATFLTHITANQAQALLEYFGGGSDLLELYRMTAGAVLDDDEPMPAGLYVISTNAREEGYTYLGDEDENAAQTFEEDKAPPAAQAVPVLTDEQCIKFMCTALRHVEYAPGTKGPTCDDIRLGLRFATHPGEVAKLKESSHD